MTIRQRSARPRRDAVGAGLLAALLVTLSASPRAAGGFPQCTALNTPVFLVGDGTLASCSQAALQTALDTAGAMGGGRMFFNCGLGPITIALSSPLTPPNNTTIDGGGVITLAASRRGASVTVDASATVVLKNLGMVGPNQMVTSSGMLTVCNCTFSGPTSALDAANAINSNGTLMITNSTFSGWSAFPGGSAISNSGTGIVNRSTFRNNGAADGGAILNQIQGTLDVTNSFFFDNRADLFGGGGAIENLGTLTVANSEFRGNAAGTAGAIENDGALIVKNSTFFNNYATYSGGGIAAGGTLTVEHSEFLMNSAGRGGGLSIAGTALIRTSTVTTNTAVDANGGGGICVTSSGSLTLTNTSVTGNTPNDIVYRTSC